MKANPIDRLFAADCLKAEVDKKYKEVKRDAEDYLAEMRDSVGSAGLHSTVFGEEAGEFKYSRTRAREVVEYDLCDAESLEDWVNDNTYGVFLYLKENAPGFGEWWFDRNGEVPEGISRVSYTEPGRASTPKIYRQNREVVLAALKEGGNFFGKANELLLGDGE